MVYLATNSTSPVSSLEPPAAVSRISRPCHLAFCAQALVLSRSTPPAPSGCSEFSKKSTSCFTYAEYRARISACAVSAGLSPEMIGPQHLSYAAPLPHGQFDWLIFRGGY